MRTTHKVVLATLNRGKFDEFKELFSGYRDIELVPASPLIRNGRKLGFVENHQTYLENAVAKARIANMACHYPTLADDSGLEVAALGGKPGVQSHRFAPPQPGKSQDQANIDFLLSQLKSSAPTDAKFVCTLAFMVEGILIPATGVLEGHIIQTPRGKNGFGYDPIFVPKGSDKTLAEMSDPEKNAISHRARALQSLMEKLKSHSIVFAKP